MVDELSNAAQSKFSTLAAAQAAALGEDMDSPISLDSGEWEDEPEVVDLGSAAVKEELMKFGE